MGRKFDALLGKTFKPNRLKALISLAISRLAVLKNQRQVRSSQARSDVLQLLNLGHHERALIRVEQVIKEQNMMDVFVMIDGYCNVLIERIHLVEEEKECPDELKDATSGLIYAASRCGEFPELQEIRAIFISKFGKEFVARATELRNNCGVNPVLIQKMSTRTPSLESRIKVLKEIALENGIVLMFDDPATISAQKELDNQKPDQPLEEELPVNEDFFADGKDEDLTDSMNMTRKYKDVGQAAEEAFKSAAQAAAAARAAVELSRPGSGGRTNYHYSNTRSQSKEEKVKDDIRSDDHQNKKGENSGKADSKHEKDQLPKKYSFDSENENLHNEIQAEDIELNESNMSLTKNHDQDSETKTIFLSNKFLKDAISPNHQEGTKLNYPVVTLVKRTWKRPISVRTKR